MDKIDELNTKITELKVGMKKKVTKNTKEYALAYYHENNTPCMCVCGKMTTSFSIYKHRFSKKHIKLMEIKALEEEIADIEKLENIEK